MPTDDDYSQFVAHPRYGQRPRITGLNPENDYGGDVHLHWHSPPENRIPNTAIRADLSRQAPATVPVTHYFDVRRQCRDCGRPFIFFAEEQKHWYEELGFVLEADCLSCAPCRKQQQGIALLREKYEALFHVPDRTPDQNLDLAECCLGLLEASVFHKRQAEHVRSLLNRASSAGGSDLAKRVDALRSRLLAFEAKARG